MRQPIIDPIAQLRAVLSGRYEIGREIGRGAFATVHLARDLRHERDVAVKVLNAGSGMEVSERRFLREIQILARLQHPNILPLIDSGHAGTLLYYVMPYVRGESLRVRLERESRLAVADAVGIAREVGDALSHAHASGLIHRDIKPENILLSAGHPIVADFGIAHVIDSAIVPHLTQTGAGSPGTPAYMSPEQISTGGRELDARSDMYSLGCVLYEMLVGAPPFAGHAGFAQRFASEPPRPSAARPEIPDELDDIVVRTLASEPEERYHSVAELIDALGALGLERHRSTEASIARVARIGSRTLRMPFQRRRSRPTTPGRRIGLALAGIAGIALLTALAVARDRDHLAIGRAALAEGRLAVAVEELRSAAAKDGGAGPRAASLLLAQALLMTGKDSLAEWRAAVTRAARGGPGMGPAETRHARALAAFAQARYDTACAELQRLHDGSPSDDVTTFVLAECHARDAAVIADTASVSGWRFRGDHELAITLYRGLLERLPVGHDARRTIQRHLPPLLTVEWGRYRRGHGYPDTSRIFGAFPALIDGPAGPAVAYVPRLTSEFRTGQPWMNPPTMARAWERDRNILRAVALAMVVEEPASPAAHATLSRSLELGGELLPLATGEPSALSEIRVARRYAKPGTEELRLRAAHVRLLVKSGRFAAARVLADSTIVARSVAPHTVRAVSGLLENLEALTGRAHRLAQRFAANAAGETQRMPDGRPFVPDAGLNALALRLGAYARLGGPRDSIVSLLAATERGIRSHAAPRARDSVRSALLGRSLSLAVPVLGPAAVTGLLGAERLTMAQHALARGDIGRVRAILDSLAGIRSGHSAAAVRLDQVFHEAWVRAAAGDTAAAARQLDDALHGLPALGTLFLSTTSEAGALGQAMMLRARLADAQRDVPTAQRWRDNARALLASADTELRP